MPEYRLGDDIDDFCVRCKRLTNHLVVSVMNGAPAKVRCRTCHSDHDFRHEQAPPPKVDSRKAALFNQVLKKVDPDEAGKPVEDADVPEVPEVPELDEAPEAVAVADDPPAPAVPAAAPKPKPKAKAKARGRK